MYNPHIKAKFLKAGRIIPAGVIATIPKDKPAMKLADAADVTF